MLRLSWLTLPSENGSGYPFVGSMLKEWTTKAGAHLVPLDSFDWDALIAVHPLNRAWIVGPHQRPDLVFHTMTEANHLPPAKVDMINRTGVAWVPSTFVEQVFRESGVHIPIFCVGYGIEARPVRRQAHDGPFRVLAWGDTLTSRKNILKVIEAFIAADLPDAQLEVKLNLSELPIPIVTWSDEGRSYDNIIISHEYWPKGQLYDWMLSGDVGVYLSAGEGYGLMPKEMMATGLPMISVINTGLTEYLRPEFVWYIPSHHMQPSPYFNRVYKTSGLMEHAPDMEAVVEALRYAYHHREEFYDMGMRGAEHVAQFTWERVGREALAHLQHHFG